MILNTSKVKTEALLLFCKDLILSYMHKDIKLFNVNEDINMYVNEISSDMLKQIENVTLPSEQYIKNRKHFRIKAVLDAYNFLNSEISKELSQDKPFNPAMLFFSLLAVWFKELDKETKSKEYIYFLIYPYTSVYDKLLVNIKDDKFKFLNISMIGIAERVIVKLDQFTLNK